MMSRSGRSGPSRRLTGGEVSVMQNGPGHEASWHGTAMEAETVGI